jgi:hypothetical protein
MNIQVDSPRHPERRRIIELASHIHRSQFRFSISVCHVFQWQPLNLSGPACFRKAWFDLFFLPPTRASTHGRSRSGTPLKGDSFPAPPTRHAASERESVELHLSCVAVVEHRLVARVPRCRRTAAASNNSPALRSPYCRARRTEPRSLRDGHLNGAAKQMEALERNFPHPRFLPLLAAQTARDRPACPPSESNREPTD